MPIDPSLLTKLPSLKLRARSVVEGVLSGLHKSPYQGQSVEFAEHKEYAPGDELRHVDWKAFGKLDRYYVKRFEHETELSVLLAIDASGSMNYGSGPLTKLDAAATLCAALAHLLIRQQDAVGLMIFGGDALEFIPPRSGAGHVQVIYEALDALTGKGKCNLTKMADALAEKARRRSAIFVFSDLFDDDEAAGSDSGSGTGGLDALLRLRTRKHEVAIFHTLDQDELDLPFDDPMRFLSMEADGKELQTHPRELRASYLEEMNAFLAATKRRSTELGSDYTLLTASEPLDRVLLRFLSRRERLRAGGGRSA
ncbi:MAG: DUF58 domain-containing protein [Myxococcales bacterium]|jgi:uncharacterized protein (DUF58 family)|nr:DUF58 domain-containing protein [Myxococcales bacterium]